MHTKSQKWTISWAKKVELQKEKEIQSHTMMRIAGGKQCERILWSFWKQQNISMDEDMFKSIYMYIYC